MEVPGRNASAMEKKVKPGLYCIPCDTDGNYARAFGYCQDCREHLCKTCFQHHTRPTPLKHHVLLDSRSMPHTQILETATDDSEWCTKHKLEQIKYYCKGHELVLCSVCVTLDHRECKIDFIPEVAYSVFENYKVDGLVSDLETIQKRCSSDIVCAEAHLHKTESNRTNFLHKLKQFRVEINNCLDVLEKSVSQEADTLLANEESKTKDLRSSAENLLKEVEVYLSDLRQLQVENNPNKLFIFYVKTKQLMHEFIERQMAYNQLSRKKPSFAPSRKILTDLRQANLGTVLATPTSIFMGKSAELKSLPEDSSWLSGIVVISDEEIIVTSVSGECAMLINVIDDKLISKLTFRYDGPFDVTCLPNNCVAVTFTELCEVRFLSYANRKLKETKCFELQFQCFGIVYSPEKLFITSSTFTRDVWKDGKIYIVDMQGVTLKCLKDNTMFNIPEYITISGDGKYLIIADAKANAVRKLDWHGNTQKSFALEGYEDPRGVLELEDGTILVCFESENVVFRLTEDLVLCDILLNGNNIRGPTAISYCKNTHQLFISCDLSGSKYSSCTYGVKRFEVKWKQDSCSL